VNSGEVNDGEVNYAEMKDGRQPSAAGHFFVGIG